MVAMPIVLIQFRYRGETGTGMANLMYEDGKPSAEFLPPMPGMPAHPPGKVPLDSHKLTPVHVPHGDEAAQYQYEGIVHIPDE
jgi:hypothetical protein